MEKILVVQKNNGQFLSEIDTEGKNLNWSEFEALQWSLEDEHQLEEMVSMINVAIKPDYCTLMQANVNPNN